MLTDAQQQNGAELIASRDRLTAALRSLLKLYTEVGPGFGEDEEVRQLTEVNHAVRQRCNAVFRSITLDNAQEN